MNTPKQRMLNAYKGIFSDYYPVAPEFWFFYPAKVLGITMVEYQKDVPHWVGMLAAFKKYNADGWGIVGADASNPDVSIRSDFKKISDDTYRDTQRINCLGKEFERSFLYHDSNPFWAESFPVKRETEMELYAEGVLSEGISYSFSSADEAYDKVGGDFLLEFDLGLPFFDFFEEAMGFEEAAYFFLTAEESTIEKLFEKYLNAKKRLLSEALNQTRFESYFIGCSSSCVSLLGATLWRKWDKPYLKEMTRVVHEAGKVIHHHSHGAVMEIVDDFVDIGLDCVCPFERAPGDVNGLDGLKKVRSHLDEKVTFNGNVHTVEALAKGTTKLVRDQVIEIQEAFSGSPRLIIGSGDQIAGETPEENIFAMIDEGRKNWR